VIQASQISTVDFSPNALIHSVSNRKIGPMWISAVAALLRKNVSGQRNAGKQLRPLILDAASEYPVDGVGQFPRNSDERL
jgi:hypothetical protein